jgi:hypothetical protein|tara:strand:+ start:2079 stop:2357 length:279 start_codon:yes stop_codon:yes gene_type:complete
MRRALLRRAPVRQARGRRRLPSSSQVIVKVADLAAAAAAVVVSIIVSIADCTVITHSALVDVVDVVDNVLVAAALSVRIGLSQELIAALNRS